MPGSRPTIDRGARPLRSRLLSARPSAARPRLPGLRFLGLALLALLPTLTAACGNTAPTHTPGPPVTPTAGVASPSSGSASASPVEPAQAAATYASIEAQVEQIRGLRPKAGEAQPTILDAAGLSDIISREFSKSNPPAVIAANELLLKAMGLLPEGASLAKLETDLLTSQVAGLYDPDSKKLYVVSKADGLGPTERVTFAHEFTHELQDQNFGLNGLATDQIGQGDRDMGRLALIEGDATDVMTIWAQQHLTQPELLQMAMDASDPQALAVLASMPPILRESLLFPYTAGLSFVTSLQATGGWSAVDAAFRTPPDSSEQILHPAKYAAHEKPVAVSLPPALLATMGEGWTSPLQDTLGEFQLSIWLRSGVPVAQANEAAAGWGGDRVELMTGPQGAWAVVIRTAWDTPLDAQQFEAAAGPTAATLAYASVIPAAEARSIVGTAGGGAAGGVPGPIVLIASDSTSLATVSAVIRLGPGRP